MLVTLEDKNLEVSVHSDLAAAQRVMHDKIQRYIKADYELYNGPYDTPWDEILNQVATKGRYDDGEYLYMTAMDGGVRQEEVGDPVVQWFVFPCPNKIGPGTVITREN